MGDNTVTCDSRDVWLFTVSIPANLTFYPTTRVICIVTICVSIYAWITYIMCYGIQLYNGICIRCGTIPMSDASVSENNQQKQRRICATKFNPEFFN